MDGVPCPRRARSSAYGRVAGATGAQWQDFERITVYSDSINDLPLMERAPTPWPPTPGEPLAAVARERAGPSCNFSP